MDTNPLKSERLSRNLTQKQLAKLAQISQNAIVKYEHGLYQHASSSIIHALYAWDLSHRLTTTHNYETFDKNLKVKYMVWRVKAVQEARPHLQKGRYYGVHPRPVGLHPMADWRTNYLFIDSQMEFCKLLVLHPSILAQYESGHTRSMPSEIKFALAHCDLPDITIEALEIEGEVFHDQLR